MKGGSICTEQTPVSLILIPLQIAQRDTTFTHNGFDNATFARDHQSLFPRNL
jgi:hypothetical protein